MILQNVGFTLWPGRNNTGKKILWKFYRTGDVNHIPVSAKEIKGESEISETRSDGSRFVRFTPMAPCETPNAVEAICESYRKALDMQAVDPLILIPIFILFQQEDSDLLGRG